MIANVHDIDTARGLEPKMLSLSIDHHITCLLFGGAPMQDLYAWHVLLEWALYGKLVEAA